MRLDLLITALSLCGSTVASAIAVSGASESPNGLGLAPRDEHGNDLFKRKGGGGGGGRGGGGRSGGSRGGSRGGSSSSKPKPGSSSSGSSGSRGGSSGSSSSGSGAPRSFGGGKYYGGGAARPYNSGSRSPGGIVPLLFVGAAALAIWPGVWLYGAHHYPYSQPYAFHNDTSNEDEELPVICGCAPYNPCGCDENEDDEYLAALIGNGDYNQLNHSLITVAEVNGTETILINGTLPNGTEAPSAAGPGMSASLELLGYWPMVAAACAAVFMGA